MTFEVREGDCVELMAAMPTGSVDAVVCDPPYGLEFMGKEWDRLGGGERRESKPGIGDRPTGWVSNRGWNAMRCRTCGHLSHGGSPCSCDAPDFAAADNRMQMMQEWHQAWAAEALRVLKPGGHLLAAGGTRTFHRLVCALEDAGFETRDTIAHMHGTGFPKSLNVGNGFGTALKPAFEPWTLARKPLSGTVAQTVLEHGTGALNVDGCRVGDTVETWPASRNYSAKEMSRPGSTQSDDAETQATGPMPAGRWPANVVLAHMEECVPVGTRKVKGSDRPNSAGKANLSGPGAIGKLSDSMHSGVRHGDADGMETVTAWECHPDCAVRLLDEQTGERPGSYRESRDHQGGMLGWRAGNGVGFDDGGSGASRFFYVAKASRAERGAGLGGVGCSCETFTGWVNEDQSPNTPPGSATPPPRATTAPNSEDDCDTSTTGFGSKPTDQSPQGSLSITSTETSRTTDSRICNSSTPARTNDSTPPTTESSWTDGSGGATSAASGSLPTPSTTTSAPKAGPSTDAVDPATSPESLATNSSARCASCGGVVQGALRNSHPT